MENCRGPGFHAGGRLEDSEFRENEARGNLGDGFYFCAWVTRIAVRNNKFVANQGSGVGGLGDSGDKENVVESNVCEANGKSGIFLWDAASNTVKNNTCLNNSQSSPGRFSGITLVRHRRYASFPATSATTLRTQRPKSTPSKNSPTAAKIPSTTTPPVPI